MKSIIVESIVIDFLSILGNLEIISGTNFEFICSRDNSGVILSSSKILGFIPTSKKYSI